MTCPTVDPVPRFVRRCALRAESAAQSALIYERLTRSLSVSSRTEADRPSSSMACQRCVRASALTTVSSGGGLEVDAISPPSRRLIRSIKQKLFPSGDHVSFVCCHDRARRLELSGGASPSSCDEGSGHAPRTAPLSSPGGGSSIAQPARPKALPLLASWDFEPRLS